MSALRLRLCQFVLAMMLAVAASAAETAPAPRSITVSFPANPRDEPLLFETNSSLFRPGTVNWWSVSVSPDGERIATSQGQGDTTGEVKIWNRADGKVKQTISEPKGVRSVAWSPDGAVLATGNYDKSVRFYDAASFKVLAATEESSGGHKGGVNGLCFFKNGKYLASAGLDKTVRIWDVAAIRAKSKAQPVAIFEGHTEGVLSVSVSADGRTLLSGSFDKTGRCYDVPDPLPAMGEPPVTIKKERVLLQGHTAAVEAVAVSPDGKLLATGSWDARMILRDRDGKNTIATEQFRMGVMCLAFSKDGKYLAAGSGNSGAPDQPGEIRVREVAEKKEAASRADYPGPVLGVAFAPDGKAVVSVGQDRALHLWPFAEKDRKTFTAPGPNFTAQPYLAGTVSPSGDLLALSGEGKSVFILDRRKSTLVAELTGHEDVIAGLAFSPDGKTFATASYDKTIKLWSTSDWKERKTLTGHTGWVLGVAFSPDSRTLATGSYDKTVRLWKVPSGEAAGTWKDHTAGVRSVAFSPNGDRLVSAGSDRIVRIWKVADGSVIHALKGHKGVVRSVGFSPNGKTVASGSEDKSVKIWDAEAGKETFAFGTLPDMVTALQFSPKGQSIAAATFQGAIVMLDPLSGRTRQILRVHNEPVSAVAFADDGQNLLSISQDRTIRQWPAVKPSAVPPAQTLAARIGIATAAAFSPNGRFAAIGNGDGEIVVWEWKSGAVQLHPGHPGGVAHLAIADDRRIASVGKDDTLRVSRENGQEQWTGKGVFAAFTPDGKHLAVAEGRDIVLRNAINGNEVKRFASGHDANVVRFTFSPDGQRLLSAGDDTKLRLWNVSTGAKLQDTPPFGNYSTVTHLAFAPDGSRFAAAAFGPEQPPPDDMTGNFRVMREVRVFPVPAADATITTTPIVFAPQPNDQPITGLEWTSNGQFLVMPASDGTIRVNELAANGPRETQRYRAHDSSILVAAVSPDAGTLITAGEDLAVRRWTMPGAEPAPGQARLTPSGLTRFWQMLPSPDGKYFVGAGEGDKTFRVYNAIPSPIPVEPDRHGSIYALAFSPDNRFVVSGHDKGAIVVREAGTGKTLRVINGMKKRVFSIGFAENGAALVAVGGNVMNGEEPGEAMIWDFAKGTIRHTLAVPVLQWMADVHPNGKSFAAAGNDGSVRIWDVASGKLVKELTKGLAGGLYSVAYDATGERIATGVYGSRVRIWDVKTEKVIHEIRTNKDLRVSQALFSPDGEEVVVSSWRGNGPDRKPEIAIYRLAEPKAEARLLPTHAASVTNIVFLPDGKTLVASGGEDKGQGSVRAYNFATGKPLGIFKGHPNWVQSLAVSRDGKVASTSWGNPLNGELRLWDARGLRPIAEVKVPGENQYVSCAAIDRSSELLVLGGWGQTLTVWDMSDPASPVLRKQMKDHTAGLRSVAFDDEGTRFVTTDESGEVKVWDARSLELITSIKVSSDAIYRARFTPDGTGVVTVGGKWQNKAKSEMRVWDPRDGKPLGRFPDQTREVWDIAFLNGGKLMAAIHTLNGAADDANVKIWDYDRKEVIRTLLPAGTFTNARCLGVSPDGKRLAVGSSSGPVKVFETANWQEVLNLPDLTNCTFGVNFTRDGSTLVIASGEGAGISVRLPQATR